MQNLIQKVHHQKFGDIRTVFLNGKIYFVGKDIAQALEYRDTGKAIRQHVQAQDKISFSPAMATGRPDKTPPQFENPHGVQIPHNAILINESGLWSLVINSKMPLAQEFQHWLTAEVIPAIIHDGYYISPAITPPKALPLVEEFTKREKVDILFKLLNLNLPPALRNKIATQILCLVSGEFEKVIEELVAQIEEVNE